jgi:hypothetical protein
MRRFAEVALMLLVVAMPSFGKTHSDMYSAPCRVLWSAVKDTLRNSGKYGILGIDDTEMTASFVIGGSLGGKRINSVVLNEKGNACEMQNQTAFSGLAHNDGGDFKKRVDESLAKQQASQPARPELLPVADNPQAAEPVESGPTVELASITVKSTPPGCDINVDGKWMGSTPSTIRLAPGEHDISIEKDEMRSWQRRMTVTSGGSSNIDATLEKP